MRHFLILLLMSLLVASCHKEVVTYPVQEITLNVNGPSLDVNVYTRATAITQVPSSLYWSATTGTLGSSESSKWTSSSKTVSNGVIATGKYQTATHTSYNYYLANTPITFVASGSTIVADNATDVITGKITSNTASPSVAMNHVFARTGTLSCTSSKGYTLSNLTYKIKSSGSATGTKGTYNIAKNTWSSTTALSEQTFNSTSDLYLIPGTYIFSVSGTMTKGDYSVSFSNSATITLAAGKINNIAATLDDDTAQSITIGVTLTAWGTTTLNPTL